MTRSFALILIAVVCLICVGSTVAELFGDNMAWYFLSRGNPNMRGGVQMPNYRNLWFYNWMFN